MVKVLYKAEKEHGRHCPTPASEDLFQPVMKRRRKVSSGARVSERYDRPQSPAQRLLA
jgi:hypothetical protein